ncbi:MAG: hypothetical protein AB7L13_16345 [Acidimicrobiia bacterium]
MDQRSVEVVVYGDGGAEIGARLSHSESAPWIVELEIPSQDRRWIAEDFSLFRSLVSIRSRLDAEGLLLGINGSRLDVYPTAMIEDAYGGRLAYLLSTRRKSNREQHDAVDIFEPAPLARLASVAAQHQAFRDYNAGLTPWRW